MKKLTLIAAAFGLAVSAHAQALGPFTALGYDASAGVNPGQVTARIGMGENALDLGVGFMYDGTDDNNDDDNLAFGVSAYYLTKLHNWGVVNNYLALGAGLNKLPQADDNVNVFIFGGLQPEVTLLDHIILSARFGVELDVTPAVMVATKGDPISIVNGMNFKVLF